MHPRKTKVVLGTTEGGEVGGGGVVGLQQLGYPGVDQIGEFGGGS